MLQWQVKYPQHHTIGAIAISGGLFSNNSLSVVIRRIDCNGIESGVLECPNVTNDDDERQCDPSETAAISCQGKEK